MTDCDDLLDAVRLLAPRLRAASARIEADGKLPDDLFQDLANTGIFKAHLPPRLGGRSARLSQLAPVIEEVSRADGSSGWLAYVGSEAGRQVLRLPEEAASTVTDEQHAFIAGMFTPGKSRAVAAPGGYRVTGHWHTCSGSLHANWIIGGTTVYDGDEPRIGNNGAPLQRLNFIPSEQVQIDTTWDVAGLRGTNSNDIHVSDIFVPEALGAYDVEPPDLGLHLMVPLGIARGAMDEFIDLANRGGPTRVRGTLHRDLPAVQREVARAEAMLRAARVYALDSLAEIDARVATGEPTTPAQRDAFFMAASHAARAALEVVDTLHRLSGTAGIFHSSRLLRCFLDVHVAVAHVSLQPINLESAGRSVLYDQQD
ncbi:MAG: acyl-CoA dehydrogenase family protein [Chloroflexi bacterium]|nr:acyl-CoA dehydrogenase family protein [Chloroflexota bacterium]